MSKISEGFIEQLLGETHDYEALKLTAEEYSKLEELCDQWEDKESIECEINIYLQTIGYVLDDEACMWVRESDEAIVLTVDQDSFIDWYYSDQSSSTLRQIAWDVISTVRETGEFKITAKTLFDNVGYLSLSLINFENEEQEEKFREAYEDEEIEDIGNIVVNGVKYRLELD